MKSDVERWLDKKDKPQGTVYANLTHIRNIKQIAKYLGRNNAVSMFLIIRTGDKNLYSVNRSGVRQRKLALAVAKELKTAKCTPDVSEMLYRFEEALEKRSVYVFNILQEAVRLTEYYPYFRAVGYAELIDFTEDSASENGEALDANVKAYNEAHPDEVREHMQSIEHELRLIEERRQRIEQAKADEKAALKRARQMAKEEAEEIKKNEARHKRRERMIERSFERYFK